MTETAKYYLEVKKVALESIAPVDSLAIKVAIMTHFIEDNNLDLEYSAYESMKHAEVAL